THPPLARSLACRGANPPTFGAHPPGFGRNPPPHERNADSHRPPSTFVRPQPTRARAPPTSVRAPVRLREEDPRAALRCSSAVISRAPAPPTTRSPRGQHHEQPEHRPRSSHGLRRTSGI